MFKAMFTANTRANRIVTAVGIIAAVLAWMIFTEPGQRLVEVIRTVQS